MIPGSVSVGYLHPGHYAACFAESLTELLFFDAANKGRIVSHAHGKLGKECGSGGIVDGRNKVASVVANESQAEWLFFVDSDMGFAPDTVERLIAAADPVDRPFVGGLCFAHKTDGKSPFFGIRYRAQPTIYDFAEIDGRVGFISRTDYERDALITADGTGGACILVHRSLLIAMQDEHGPNWFTPITHPKGPTTFSEDLSFCARAAALGVQLHIHTGIKTTHDKGGVFLDEDYFDRQQSLLAMQGA